MRIVEQIQLKGHAIAAGPGKLRIARGVAVVMIDEDAVRAMIRDAVKSRGGRSKRGPLHVRFVGDHLLRLAGEAEREDDIYRGHEWATKPASL
jgi:hypothetical protein